MAIVEYMKYRWFPKTQFFSSVLNNTTKFEFMSCTITYIILLRNLPRSISTVVTQVITVTYQAHLSNNPPGHFRTPNFLSSSKNKIPRPNVAGKKKCSAGTLLVWSVLWSCGIYSQKIAIQRAKAMAGNKYQFWVCLLKSGGCWKILRRRVRKAIKLNHCLKEL